MHNRFVWRSHRVRIFSCIIISCILMSLCSACEPPTDTAIGHSYNRETANQYVPRDDDGDVGDVCVDIITPISSHQYSYELARKLEKSGIAVRLRQADKVSDQIEQVKNAISDYSRFIVIPYTSVAQASQQWLPVLKLARSKKIPVVIAHYSHHMQDKTYLTHNAVVSPQSTHSGENDNEQKYQEKLKIDKIYYAGLWIFISPNTIDINQKDNADTHKNRDGGDINSFDQLGQIIPVDRVVMMIVEDKPHNTIIMSAL